MKKVRLLGISPYEGMKEMMLNVAQYRTDIELTALVGDLEEGARLAEQHSADIDGIVSRGGTAELIRKGCVVPVTEITLSVYDVLRAIRLAQSFSEHFAIVGFSGITSCARPLCDLLQFDIPVHTVHDADEVAVCLKKLSQQGYSIILGDVVTATNARQMGMNGILITSGAESIQQAFNQAVQTYASQAEFIDRSNLLAALLNTSTEASAAYSVGGELLCAMPNPPDDFLNNLMKHSVEKVAAHRHYETKRRFEDVLFELRGDLVTINDTEVCLFHIVSNQLRELSSENWIRYYSSDENPPPFDNFFGTGNLMQKALRSAEQYSQVPIPLLLTGVSGSSFDELAYMIYRNSRFAEMPFILIDCEHISARKLQFLFTEPKSPLLGKGYTLYFKNVGKLSPEYTEYLITYIDTSLYSGNRILFSQPENSSMLLDTFGSYVSLFSTCSTLRIPSLCERTEDISSLSAYYINNINFSIGKQVLGLDSDASALARSYSWPGDTAQLRSVINELVIEATLPYITGSEVEYALTKFESDAGNMLDLNRPLREISCDIAQLVLKEENMNQTRAAKRLGISRSTLWKMLKNE